jgi:hypothetical protein
MQAELEGAFHLTFRAVELLGRLEAGQMGDADAALLRLLTPIAKLTTARQAVAVASEAVEAFGGAGYVEDTGLPAILRDTQVLSIWEGTTNVLSLDVLRALDANGLEPIGHEIDRCLGEVRDPSLAGAARASRDAYARAQAWLHSASSDGRPALEAGARRFAMTLGRAVELALLCSHAQWSIDNEADGRAAAAARRLMANGVDLLAPVSRGDSAALATDS